MLEVIDLGLLPYPLAHAEQLTLVEKKKRWPGLDDYLLFVEHPDVYTYGRKSKDVILAENAFAVERGGEATFHNPGQLVAYPILSLQESERDIHRYLRTLEDALIDCLGCFEIRASRVEGATGVWVDDGRRKIASIGVAVSSWVTYHGVALNVVNDLRGYSKINPCGFSASVMTSMKQELGDICPTLERVRETFLKSFCAHFEREIGCSHVVREKSGQSWRGQSTEKEAAPPLRCH